MCQHKVKNKFWNSFLLGTIRLNCHLVKSQLCLLLCVWFTAMDRPLFLLSVTCEFGLWWGGSIKLLRSVIAPLLLRIDSWLVLFLANLRVRRNWKINKHKNYHCMHQYWKKFTQSKISSLMSLLWKNAFLRGIKSHVIFRGL